MAKGNGYVGAAVFVAAIGMPVYWLGRKAQDEQQRRPVPSVASVDLPERVGNYCTWDDWDRAVHHGADTVRDEQRGCYEVT